MAVKVCDEYCGAEECLHNFGKPYDEQNCQRALGNPEKFTEEKDTHGRPYRVYYFTEKRIRSDRAAKG